MLLTSPWFVSYAAPARKNYCLTSARKRFLTYKQRATNKERKNTRAKTCKQRQKQASQPSTQADKQTIKNIHTTHTRKNLKQVLQTITHTKLVSQPSATQRLINYKHNKLDQPRPTTNWLTTSTKNSRQEQEQQTTKTTRHANKPNQLSN